MASDLCGVQLRCVGTKLPEWMTDRRRQFKWERNDIDYMGADSFENIRRRLDSVILGHEGAAVINAAIDALSDAARNVGTDESFIGELNHVIHCGHTLFNCSQFIFTLND